MNDILHPTVRSFNGLGSFSRDVRAYCLLEAALDAVDRFASARQVAGYLGLAPTERSSGELQRRGRISKTGNPRVRVLLVEAGWRLLRSRQPLAAPLRAWAERIAVRRGRAIAAVALARRLARILYAVWRDGGAYQPARLTHAA
ncbi:MAG: transposase [Candidatus Acidiferrales bacterium]